MRAVVLESFGAPDVLVLRDMDEPVPQPGWVTVDLRAAALNWHDVLVRRGRYKSPLPHILGADGAGTRRDTGESVVILPSLFWGTEMAAPGPDFEILGDRVPGTYADSVSVPAECLAPVPPGWSWEEAAALSLVGVTAYRALVTRANLKPGESLLVVGAGGGISTTAVSLARALGADAYVTASSRGKLDRALAAGAEAGVLHTAEGWGVEARHVSPDGRGFDVILDSVGLWATSAQALRPGGRLVVLGANVAETALMDVRSFFFGQFSLLGTTMGSPDDFRGLSALLSRGVVGPPTIASTMSMSRAADAHRMLEAGRHFGKIVLTTD